MDADGMDASNEKPSDYDLLPSLDIKNSKIQLSENDGSRSRFLC
jgi:hypothetical protein